METKILQVFYDNNGLPYKDQERLVHFPIVGSGFQGASNTTQIRFYFGTLGDTGTSWVATSKLPNGKIGSKVLTVEYDSELNEYYALMVLDSFYFQYKGDVFISLQGYDGGIEYTYDSEEEIYTINGTPTIQATGSIKIAINYATQFIGSGEESNADMQSLLALLGTKVTKTNTGQKVYVTLANGSQDTFTWDYYANQYTIPRRDINGAIKVGNPATNGDAVNLYYLNDNYGYLKNHIGYTDFGLFFLDVNGLSFKSTSFSQTANTDSYETYRFGGSAYNKSVNLNVEFSNINLKATTGITLRAPNNITVYNDILKASGIAVNIGSSTNRFSKGYFSNLYTPKLIDNRNNEYLLGESTNGQTYTIAPKSWVEDYVASQLSSVYKPQGSASVSSLNALTKSSEMNGYVYNVTTDGSLTNQDSSTLSVNAGDNVVFLWESGSWKWDDMSSFVDLSSYWTSTQTQNYIASQLADRAIFAGEVASTKVADFYNQYGTGIFLLNITGRGWILDLKTVVIGDSSITVTGSAISLEIFEQRVCNYASISLTENMYNLLNSVMTASYPLTSKVLNSSHSVVNLYGDKPVIFKINGSTDNNLYIGSFTMGTTNIGTVSDPLYEYEIEIECLDNANRWIRTGSSSNQYISLTIADVMNSTYLHIYEDSTNKVTSLSGSSTDTQYPSAKCVWDISQDIREVAEGKCDTFILSYEETVAHVKTLLTNSGAPYKAYKYLAGSYFDEQTPTEITSEVINGDYDSATLRNSLFNSQNASLSVTAGVEYPNKSYLILRQDFNFNFVEIGATSNISFWRIGDIVLVIETDVPDRWIAGTGSSATLYKLETAKVSLDNYYTKNHDLVPSSNGTYVLGNIDHRFGNLYLGGVEQPQIDFTDNYNLSLGMVGFYRNDVNMQFSCSSGNFVFDSNILPKVTNSSDLGSSTYKFKDINFAGSLKGGTTLTQSQYDALVSGGTVDSDTFYFIEEE